jgi:uncharacterized membrane protein YphA (DoxX/SURF4 family)
MLSRILVGIVFVFSGFVKAIDPLGSAYKFGDYFSAFNLDFLSIAALPLSIFLSALELTLGFSLLISYRIRSVSWIVLIFMSFFTVLTFILAIYNPVTDCGCFGDALILTNWETFFKNIIIMFFVLIIYIQRYKFTLLRKPNTEWAIIIIFFLASAGLSLHAFNNLPPLDFRPYSVGSDIPAKMEFPPDAPRDEYETTLIYKNKESGINEEFSMENFPSDTNLYTFVDANSKLVRKGYEPPIYNFSLTSLSGSDITDILLNSNKYSYLLISHDLAKANAEGLKKAEIISRITRLSEGIDFYCLTSSSEELIKQVRDSLNLTFPFYQVDEITLKTIVRANPGLMLIKSGVVLGKWHYRNFPHNFPGLIYKNISENYPFAVGIDLHNAFSNPPGSEQDVYQTSLYYRNINSDSVSKFSINDFPQSSEWVFEKSTSERISSESGSPFDDFNPVSVEGSSLKSEIINSKDNVFLSLLKNPQTIDPELLNRINNLSVMTTEYLQEKTNYYLITSLPDDELIKFGDSFISPIRLGTNSQGFIEKLAGDGIAYIWIRNGRVVSFARDNEIPSSANLSEYLNMNQSSDSPDKLILPDLLESYRFYWEKQFVYLFIFAILVFGLLLRVYFEEKKPEY